MDFVTILRELWHRRALVLLVFGLAAAVAVMVAFRISLPPKLESRKYVVGISTARVLIDTPNSQVVEVAPNGSDTLGSRASLLASLMVDGVVKSAIAERAGLRPEQLIAVSESGAEGSAPAKAPSRLASALTTKVITNSSGDQLPIIDVEAQAPDAQRAARLANAAVSGLRAYLDSKAGLQRIPEAKRLQVTGLGASQAANVVRGSRDVLAIIAFIVIFAAGCATILVVFALARDWREASQDELPREVDAGRPTWRSRFGEDPHDRAAAAVPPSAEPLREVREA